MDEKLTPIFDGTMSSIKSVIPFPSTFHSITSFQAPLQQTEVGVLISLTGDLHLRFILEGEMSTLSRLGEAMFGVKLEDQLLESFAGELGNMLVGNFSTYLATHGYVLDITPPTVMVGMTKLYGFEQAFCLPFEIESIGMLHMNIIIDAK